MARRSGFCEFFVPILLNPVPVLPIGLRSSRFDSDKVVIAVSTVLTWLGTTPAASGVFTEGSHKRRKPTPRYTPTKTLETHVLSLARDGVRVQIVAAGIQYGGGENDLHFLFRVRSRLPQLRVPRSRCLTGGFWVTGCLDV
jgi:hypothetical protein